MQEDFEVVDHVITWSEAALAVLALLGALWVGIKKVYKIAKNIETLVKNSEDHTKRLVEIEKQVAPNGGSSLRDAVERIEKRLEALESIPCHLPRDSEDK